MTPRRDALILSFALAAFVLLGLPGAFAQSTATPPSLEPSLVKELLAPAGGDLQELVARRFIRALVVYDKVQYFLDGARERGVVYDFTQAFADKLNADLGLKGREVVVACIPVARDQLISYLAQGRGDIAAANLTVTEERKKLVDFAFPLARNVKEVLVAGRKAPLLKTLDDLAGKEVFVRKSSSYAESLRQLNERFRAKGQAEVRILDADEHLEDVDIVEMADAGMIGLTVIDDYKAERMRLAFNHVTIREDLVLRQGGEISLALRKGAPELAARLSEFSREYAFNSSKFMYLYKKYTSPASILHNNLGSGDFKRFQEASAYFKQYGKLYGFDYLLIAAQGYQESRLDQRLRSPAGALGVMQIRPKTAKDPNVSVGSIEKLSNNIQAGVKYNRFLLDRYFNEPQISALDRQLFAIAAYNAGPARIMKLRQEARETGLDENKWFDNVERIASLRIGAETVRYVANIYKYYVAYQLAQGIAERRRLAKRLVRG